MNKDQSKRNIELVLRYQGGDESALETLIEENYSFICMIARERIDRKKHDRKEFVGVSAEGMIKAAKTFDVSRGFRFLSYAGVIMRRDVLDAIMMHGGAIKVPIFRQKKHKPDSCKHMRELAKKCGTINHGGYIECKQNPKNDDAIETASIVRDAIECMSDEDRELIYSIAKGVQSKTISSSRGVRNHVIWERLAKIRREVKKYIETVNGVK